MQTRTYNAFRVALAANAVNMTQWRDSVPPEDVRLLALRVSIEGSITFPVATTRTDPPTRAEVLQWMQDAVADVQFFNATYGPMIDGALTACSELARITHGMEPIAIPAVGTPVPVGLTIPVRFHTRIPFTVPVGREAQPMELGGRGSRRHAPMAGQLREDAVTLQITAGPQAGTTWGGLACTWTAAPTIAAYYEVESAPEGRNVRVAPLQWRQRTTQPLTDLGPGLFYGVILGTAIDADTIGATPIEVRADGGLLYEAGRVDARELVADAYTAQRYQSIAALQIDALNPNAIPMLWPNMVDHNPIKCDVGLTLGDAGANWGLGVATVAVSLSANQRVRALNGEGLPIADGPAAPVLVGLTQAQSSAAQAASTATQPLSLR